MYHLVLPDVIIILVDLVTTDTRQNFIKLIFMKPFPNPSHDPAQFTCDIIQMIYILF